MVKQMQIFAVLVAASEVALAFGVLLALRAHVI